MKTLQEIKDEHAKELGFTDFEEMFSEALHTGVDYCVDAIAMNYANQKLDEAAEKATTKTEKRLIKNHVLNNLNPTGIRMEFTVVDKQSILSLKDQI